jgi:hypothetical protein
MPKSLERRLATLLQPDNHPQKKSLISILSGKTSVSSTGYPYLSEISFRTFTEEVPHLFREGDMLLSWIAQVESQLESARLFAPAELSSVQRGLFVLRQIVQSAAVCAPSDLWILRHVLSVHSALGLTSLYKTGAQFDLETTAAKYHLDPRHLNWDFSLLNSRGYMETRARMWQWCTSPAAKDVLQKITELPSDFMIDWVELFVKQLSGQSSQAEQNQIADFLTYEGRAMDSSGWEASFYQMEIGYRLVPMILALHVLKIREKASEGVSLPKLLPFLSTDMARLLADAGIVTDDLALTALGVRVLNRAPGPFGIIHAYLPYMRVLADKLGGKASSTWVQRGKNIAASQDANRKTFEMANDRLDQFVTDHQITYHVFIEHALGQGEAVRQRWKRSGDKDIQYFGADLEDAAIDRAIALQQQGVLPPNMIFIRRADIANPQIVIDAVRSAGFATEGAIMFVGNGFHEIRGQTNEKIVSVFRQYCDAGMIVVFTEESALGDKDLQSTAWNTYHAGFRYVHELSGQGLRPVYGTDKVGRHSWRMCAALGGYAVIHRYCAHTRTIYPYPRKGGYNPPISMTYFCVPSRLALELGFFPLAWSSIRQ